MTKHKRKEVYIPRIKWDRYNRGTHKFPDGRVYHYKRYSVQTRPGGATVLSTNNKANAFRTSRKAPRGEVFDLKLGHYIKR